MKGKDLNKRLRELKKENDNRANGIVSALEMYWNPVFNSLITPIRPPR